MGTVRKILGEENFIKSGTPSITLRYGKILNEYQKRDQKKDLGNIKLRKTDITLTKRMKKAKAKAKRAKKARRLINA